MPETLAPAATGAPSLDAATVARFRQQGYLSPLTVMSEAEMADNLRQLDEIEAQRAGRLLPQHNVKVHLLAPFLWDIVHHPAILDRVEALLGPDLLCWAASFFDKKPGTTQHVPWHQDATYWGLSAPEALTAWVAFTPSVVANGCMRVSPGTHHVALAHVDTGDNDVMLPGREEIEVEVDEAHAVDIVLHPGEMSLHDVLLVHGSQANTSGLRRCGFAIRYIPGHLTSTGTTRASATLVRGRDHGHFDLEQRPEAPFHPEALKRYNGVLRQWMRTVLPNMGKDAQPGSQP
ncbi:phytanoyl-CoA dioxygenase family protein [Ancylobacter sp. Lp-2]|uniref:phytanoyl-CoA dioxygenase family protein n=1 Tax=Ancylobacter sp. Lp-2 TaxID=2881339 RepID=UPI001E60243A|nr:phytanoyl-CoA dioxygenase family protein [Ancylobacter sp. Lp-2]MCB4768484.1 phytanoyl-CoA dioxygenase family protein [Ancylobacter sp. Lp-2]